MKPYPLLVGPTLVYTRLKALSWSVNGTAFVTQVEAAAGRVLASLLHNHSVEDTGKPVIINCRGILEIDDRALDAVKSVIAESSCPIAFSSANPMVVGRLTAEVGPPTIRIPTARETSLVIFGGGGRTNDEWITLQSDAGRLEQSELSQFIRHSYRKHDSSARERLASTPLMSTGILNARRLISNPHSFIWISLNMADLVEDLVLESEFPQSRARLLAVSLRASPFAAAISFLLPGRPFQVEIVDHLGPHHEVLEEDLIQTSSATVRYIFVADFILGGTELKIAQYYARTHGALLEHAVAIGSLMSPEAYGPRVTARALVRIPECCPEAKFALDYEH